MERYGFCPIEYTLWPKKQIAHGGIAHHHHLVNAARGDRKFLDGVAQVTGQRPPQQFARMLAVVMDARHHVGTAEPLRVFERRIGDAGAGLQVEKTQHHGGGSQVHGDAV